jgi:hypothetical protein
MLSGWRHRNNNEYEAPFRRDERLAQYVPEVRNAR